jgi:hypothetical protein
MIYLLYGFLGILALFAIMGCCGAAIVVWHCARLLCGDDDADSASESQSHG